VTVTPASALPGVPVLETERLILRAPQAADAPAFVAYATSDRTRFVGGPKPAPLAYEKFCSLIGHWIARGFGRFVIEAKADGAAMGHVGPLQLDDSQVPEITWTLWDARFEGQGYATEAARAVLDWLPGATGIDALWTQIHQDNHASQSIARKLGGVVDADAKGWMPGAQTWRFALTDGGIEAYA
jgi:[ribosomal protein S5]-alanine N-acetyltransferase